MSSTTQIGYAVAKIPTPLLDNPNWEKTFKELPLDDQNLLRGVEAVAFANTAFVVEEVAEEFPTHQILKVTTPEYPNIEGKKVSVYVDSRFLTLQNEKPTERTFSSPTQEAILDGLYEQVAKKTTYIWGGNIPDGIPELLTWYKHDPMPEKNSLEHKQRSLQGVDCSGLLYYLSNGFSPRNTSDLLNFGKDGLEDVDIESLSTEEALATQLKPLDLIVWKGHVVIVGKHQDTIESKTPEGVVQTRSLGARLKDVLLTKTLQHECKEKGHFVIRRWAHLLRNRPS